MNRFEVLDFLEEVDFLGELGMDDVAVVPRQSNTYIRNFKNPFEFYSNSEFRDRFRFYKETVRDIIMPLFAVRNDETERGLPIPMEIQIAIALRYYASGSFQVSR